MARPRIPSPVILAIDQGTTSTTCLVVDDELRILGRAMCPVHRHYPQPGWVEHDPDELLTSVERATAAALENAGIGSDAIACAGIANQRETAIVWDARTGRPLHRALVWQDRRTAVRCAKLPAQLIRERTGLVPDPYFSATKFEWLLRATDGDAERRCGTVDTWLVWNLTHGDAFVTDVSNAARTMVFDIHRRAWDDDLLTLFGIDRRQLPHVVPSVGIVGEADLGGRRIPIAALAGDQQAALVGQACFAPGQTKATYGTGAFLLANAGPDSVPAAPDGLLLTLAAQLHAPGDYALEGSVLAAGAAIDWLADGLGLIGEAAEADAVAGSVSSSGGVHLVPALAGLGSPYWEPAARGTITGLTQGSTRAHVVRAALESIAYRTRDILERMPFALTALRVDGGVTASTLAMQSLADVTQLPIEIAAEPDATALGAAALAGIACGIIGGPEDVAARWRCAKRFEPALGRDAADEAYAAWQRAVARAL